MKRYAAALSIVVFAMGCHRAVPPSGVTAVEARIDGITCPTCVPPLEASLKRQYTASEIHVDDDKDTASIRFAKGEDFSAGAFQDAVTRVRMRVVNVRLQACGVVEQADGEKWMQAGSNRFRLRSERSVPVGGSICADGTLDTRATPATFEISAFTENGR